MNRPVAVVEPRSGSPETPWQNLREANFLLRTRMVQQLGQFELSLSDFVVLDLCGKAPARVSEVARVLGLTAAGTTDALDRLEARRLVRRRTDANDRRAVQVLITPAGRRVLKRANSAKEETIRYLDATMSHDERRALAEGLGALTRALRRKTAVGA
jgi:DNA-binding MarR family transcriptional regulator